MTKAEAQRRYDQETRLVDMGFSDAQAEALRSVTGILPNPEGEANARLISAAPELLEALRAVQVIAYAQVDGNKAEMREALLECIRKTRAAIAKAEGR